MDRAGSRAKQHLALPTAASLVYFTVTGRVPDAISPRFLQRTLNDVAHAISLIAPIYEKDAESGLPRQITTKVLITAAFEHGGNVLITDDGVQHRGLTVVREDMEAAANLLRSSQIKKRWIELADDNV